MSDEDPSSYPKIIEYYMSIENPPTCCDGCSLYGICATEGPCGAFFELYDISPTNKMEGN